MADSKNSFSLLEDSDDDSSDEGINCDDAQDVISSSAVCLSSSTKNNTLLLTATIDANVQRQSGGMLTMRVDPVVGLNSDKTLDLGFSPADLEACVKVIDALGKNPNLFKLSNLKPLRASLHPLIMEQMKSNYGVANSSTDGNISGKGSIGKKRKWRGRDSGRDSDAADREAKIASLEAEYINQTQLRALRMQQLESLNEEGAADVPRVPDGAALAIMPASEANAYSPRLLLGNGGSSDKDRHGNGNGSSNATSTGTNTTSTSVKSDVARRLALLKSTSASTSSTSLLDISVPNIIGESSINGDLVELRDPISCYICHKPYRKLHFFYHLLCPDCAEFNYAKRNEMADMTGKVCLVTGARCKIGFRCALKLLRCGAHVIATTRFPHDAAKRYLAEEDAPVWTHRLHVYGLDFRNLSALEAFCAYVNTAYERLDVIINNAAQTVRRPPAFYAHLLEGEKMIENSTSTSSTTASCGAEESKHDCGTSDAGGENSKHNSAQHQQQSSKKEAEALKTVLGHQYNFMALLNRATSAMPAAIEDDSSSRRGGKGSCNDTRDRSGSVESVKSIDVPTASAGHSDTNKVSNSSSSSGVSAVSSVNVSTSTSLAAVPATSSTISSSAMTQLQLTAGDDEVASATSALFPLGATDVNGQQVDLRKHNSWTMRLHEVSTPELAEVFAINSIAPTVINARLKGLMERDAAAMKFIVNVSAMEGKFYRYKSDAHPHTNMAKAALNMMTRTSAQDYVKSRIYMTAVDTGWINDEKPVELAAKHHQQHGFQTPIDEIDAAARVLDPVIAPLLAKQRGAEVVEPPWGFFLKDYQKCEW